MQKFQKVKNFLRETNSLSQKARQILNKITSQYGTLAKDEKDLERDFKAYAQATEKIKVDQAQKTKKLEKQQKMLAKLTSSFSLRQKKFYDQFEANCLKIYKKLEECSSQQPNETSESGSSQSQSEEIMMIRAQTKSLLNDLLECQQIMPVLNEAITIIMQIPELHKICSMYQKNIQQCKQLILKKQMRITYIEIYIKQIKTFNSELQSKMKAITDKHSVQNEQEKVNKN